MTQVSAMYRRMSQRLCEIAQRDLEREGFAYTSQLDATDFAMHLNAQGVRYTRCKSADPQYVRFDLVQ